MTVPIALQIPCNVAQLTYNVTSYTYGHNAHAIDIRATIGDIAPITVDSKLNARFKLGPCRRVRRPRRRVRSKSMSYLTKGHVRLSDKNNQRSIFCFKDRENMEKIYLTIEASSIRATKAAEDGSAILINQDPRDPPTKKKQKIENERHKGNFPRNKTTNQCLETSQN